MDPTSTTLKIDSGGGPEAIREAAAIWSEATAVRDGTLTARKVEELIPGIRGRLSLDEAELLIARSSGNAAGFTLYGPRPDTLEIFYLAVHPEAWGRGVGSQLLRAVENRARELDRKMLELWVIEDNKRAISVYAKNGFVSTDDTKDDSCSARTERRFSKELSCQGFGPGVR
jgi:ribosomal protein S18 acetylase RimI-like enzyme